MASTAVFEKCPLCSFEGSSPQSFTQHVLRSHKWHPSFRVQCSIESCGRTFTKWSSFRSHTSRKHKNLNTAVPNETENSEEDNLCNPANSSQSSEEFLVEQGTAGSPDLRWCDAAYLLQAQHKYHVPQSLVNDFISDTSMLFQDYLDRTKANLVNHLSHNSLHPGIVNTHDAQMLVDKCFDRPFREICSYYKLQKFCKEHVHLTEPIGVKMGEELIWKNIQGKKKLVRKQNFGHIVPFYDSLRDCLTIPEIHHCVNNSSHAQGVTQYTDIHDGQYVQNNTVLSENKSLKIILYYDDVEFANPLGSKKRKHKLGLFYWLLGNIDKKYRSSLKVIQLLAVCNTSSIRKYGIENLLQDFFHNINKLGSEEGLTFTINGVEETYHGGLVFVAADTLASCFLGGFKEGVGSAYRGCRTCMGKKNDWRNWHNESKFTLRTKESHNEQLSVITDVYLTEESRKYWGKEFGITANAVLHKCIPNFDVTNCLVHDVMHVVFEGVLNLECRLLLTYVIFERKLISLERFNQELDCCKIQHDNVCHPSPINETDLKEGKKLSQSAAQMLVLGLALPFIIQDKIPDNDEKFNLFLTLLQISKFCCAVEFTSEDTIILEKLIEMHNQKFTVVYPEVNVTPKMHYLVHLPRQIRLFGPLRYQSCMRFEAKHSYFKNLVSRSKNFKNLSKLCAVRHQQMQYSQRFADKNHYQMNTFLGLNQIDIRSSVFIPISQYDFAEAIPDWNTPNDTPEYITVISEITHCGIAYKNGAILILQLDEDDLPCFGEIVSIIKHHNSNIILILRKMETVSYEEKTLSYKIQDTHTFECIQVPGDLVYTFPTYVVRYSSGSALQERYVIINDYVRFEMC